MESMAPRNPGMIDTPASLAILLEEILSPIAAMASVPGPMNFTPMDCRASEQRTHTEREREERTLSGRSYLTSPSCFHLSRAMSVVPFLSPLPCEWCLTLKLSVFTEESIARVDCLCSRLLNRFQYARNVEVTRTARRRAHADALIRHCHVDTVTVGL